jgi:hypothetical protein
MPLLFEPIAFRRRTKSSNPESRPLERQAGEQFRSADAGVIAAVDYAFDKMQPAVILVLIGVRLVQNVRFFRANFGVSAGLRGLVMATGSTCSLMST